MTVADSQQAPLSKSALVSCPATVTDRRYSCISNRWLPFNAALAYWRGNHYSRKRLASGEMADAPDLGFESTSDGPFSKFLILPLITAVER
jgi:hypothetical protein